MCNECKTAQKRNCCDCLIKECDPEHRFWAETLGFLIAVTSKMTKRYLEFFNKGIKQPMYKGSLMYHTPNFVINNTCYMALNDSLLYQQ
jgi:hypothetical protein